MAVGYEDLHPRRGEDYGHIGSYVKPIRAWRKHRREDIGEHFQVATSGGPVNNQERAAQIWCHPKLRNRVMDTEMAFVIAEALDAKDAEWAEKVREAEKNAYIAGSDAAWKIAFKAGQERGREDAINSVEGDVLVAPEEFTPHEKIRVFNMLKRLAATIRALPIEEPTNG